MEHYKSICEYKVHTINDLPLDTQRVYISNYIDRHSDTISKHLGFLMPIKLKQGFLGSLLLRIQSIKMPQRFITKSTHRFSEQSIEIPKNLHIMGALILEKDFKQKGIFRVNSTKARLRAAKTLLYDIVEDRMPYEKGKRLFHKNFDLIDAAETYKQLLRGFNTTIIPESCVSIILKIEAIEDEEAKKICATALILSLPFLNRKILESHIFMCYSIVERIHVNGHSSEQMDISGISSVMMPNIILKSSKNVAISEVLILVPFTKFLFKEFKNLIATNKEYL